MTELSGACHCTPFAGDTKSGSVGLLLPNLECKVSAPVSVVCPPEKECIRNPTGGRGFPSHKEDGVLVVPVKPGSFLCDKHNTSDISISTRKKDHVLYRSSPPEICKTTYVVSTLQFPIFKVNLENGLHDAVWRLTIKMGEVIK